MGRYSVKRVLVTKRKPNGIGSMFRAGKRRVAQVEKRTARALAKHIRGRNPSLALVQAADGAGRKAAQEWPSGRAITKTGLDREFRAWFDYRASTMPGLRELSTAQKQQLRAAFGRAARQTTRKANGRSYSVRGVSVPLGYQPRAGEVWYLEGRKAVIKRVGVSDGTPYVWFARPVDGTLAMSVRNLIQAARLDQGGERNPRGLWPQPFEVDRAINHRAQAMARSRKRYTRAESDSAADRMVSQLYGRNAMLEGGKRAEIRTMLWNDYQSYPQGYKGYHRTSTARKGRRKAKAMGLSGGRYSNPGGKGAGSAGAGAGSLWAVTVQHGGKRYTLKVRASSQAEAKRAAARWRP